MFEVVGAAVSCHSCLVVSLPAYLDSNLDFRLGGDYIKILADASLRFVYHEMEMCRVYFTNHLRSLVLLKLTAENRERAVVFPFVVDAGCILDARAHSKPAGRRWWIWRNGGRENYRRQPSGSNESEKDEKPERVLWGGLMEVGNIDLLVDLLTALIEVGVGAHHGLP